MSAEGTKKHNSSVSPTSLDSLFAELVSNISSGCTVILGLWHHVGQCSGYRHTACGSRDIFTLQIRVQCNCYQEGLLCYGGGIPNAI